MPALQQRTVFAGCGAAHLRGAPPPRPGVNGFTPPHRIAEEERNNCDLERIICDRCFVIGIGSGQNWVCPIPWYRSTARIRLRCAVLSLPWMRARARVHRLPADRAAMVTKVDAGGVRRRICSGCSATVTHRPARSPPPARSAPGDCRAGRATDGTSRPARGAHLAIGRDGASDSARTVAADGLGARHLDAAYIGPLDDLPATAVP